ncbi:MAG: FecR domain-containing protein [Bacteroidota bacterium]
MSDENPYSVDEALVAKFFSQETTEEENDRLHQWREASAANQRQFKTWQVVWADTGALKPWDQSLNQDLDGALDQVRIRREQILENELKHRATPWVWRAAAVLLVGVGLGWYLFSSQQSEVFEWVAEADPVTTALEDGTSISLNAGSRLEVRTVSEKRREVYLQGEAYFEVTPDPQRPFVIQTEKVKVEVLGTSFNVSETDGTQTIVSVEEGRVRLSRGDQELILSAGQTGAYDHLTTDLALLEMEDTGEYRFWKTKKLVFRGQTLSDVISTLNRTYEQSIILADAALGDCLLTVSFEDESLDNILEVIAITLGLELSREEDQIVIDGEGC